MSNSRAAATLAIVLLAFDSPTFADEGGISFWLPGQDGSLVAVPPAPGWAFAMIYFHPFSQVGARQDIPRGGRVDLGVEGSGDLLVLGPSYTFKRPLLGGPLR